MQYLSEKAPTTTPGKVKRLVEWVKRHATKKTDLPMDRLFHFFQTQILTISAKLGLLGTMDALSVAGDGTPVVTAAYPRSKFPHIRRSHPLNSERLFYFN